MRSQDNPERKTRRERRLEQSAIDMDQMIQIDRKQVALDSKVAITIQRSA
jgi:hypothetical protein